MRIKYLVIITLFLAFSGNGLLAQRFEGALVAGFNASQIDGDNYWGYDKLGLTGGLKMSYQISNAWYASMEMLYSQRGSQSKFNSFSTVPIHRINLQYIELPVMASYKDWWIEGEDYFKVNAEAGLSYAYLFDSTVSEGGFSLPLSDFVTTDISFLLGAHYFINRHWGFGIRYTRAINKLYKNPNTNERDLLSYFLTFRALYQF